MWCYRANAQSYRNLYVGCGVCKLLTTERYSRRVSLVAFKKLKEMILRSLTSGGVHDHREVQWGRANLSAERRGKSYHIKLTQNYDANLILIEEELRQTSELDAVEG